LKRVDELCVALYPEGGKKGKGLIKATEVCFIALASPLHLKIDIA
jgi:hypothetical protein